MAIVYVTQSVVFCYDNPRTLQWKSSGLVTPLLIRFCIISFNARRPCFNILDRFNYFNWGVGFLGCRITHCVCPVWDVFPAMSIVSTGNLGKAVVKVRHS